MKCLTKYSEGESDTLVIEIIHFQVNMKKQSDKTNTLIKQIYEYMKKRNKNKDFILRLLKY